MLNKKKINYFIGIWLIISITLVGIFLTQKKQYSLLTQNEAKEIFEQFIDRMYTGKIVNQLSCFAKEYCGNEPKELELDKGLFRYIKREKLELLNKEPLFPVYCECVNENEKCVKNPFVFKCINKNRDITYLFYSSPSPCINYTIYILPKLSNSIEDLIKPEFLEGENVLERTNTSLLTYLVAKYPLLEKVMIEQDRIILRSEQYTCH
ncbi:MAG: hypothetical protein RMJ17_03140 [Candidatus Aenigmarchaeota archaeon]|nr:hypothetical protein [Candidatus Aenigmarchaeota archaeon]MDW8149562.1 hypothetical protein [Candidatus Aenigmarchaeota archaeon]